MKSQIAQTSKGPIEYTLLGETRGLYWLVPVMILLIWDACMNAWDLVLRLREQPAVA